MMQLHRWDQTLAPSRVFAWCFLASLIGMPWSAADSISFRSQIAPILQNNCVACHCARKAEGGYRLDTFAEMSKSGDSGIAPLEKEDAETVELVRRLTTSDDSERMPAESESLSDDQINTIKAWIESGAKFDGEDPADLLPLVIPPPIHPHPPESYPAPLQVTAVCFSPDGSQVLTGGYHEVLVWSIDGKLERRITNIGQQTYAMAFDGDGARLAVACGQPGRDGEVRLVEMASGEVKAVLVRSEDVILDVAFRPDGKELAVAAADKSVRLVNMETLEVTRTLASHADWVTSIGWSRDGKRLVSASRDKSAKVFDAESGQLLVSYQGHNAAVRGVAILADGTQVVSSGSDNKLHRWDIESAKKLGEVGLGGEGYRLLLGVDWVIVPTSAHTLLKIDVAKNRVMTTYKDHGDWVLAAAGSPDQSLFASGDYRGEVRVWNAADGTVVSSWLAKP